ncbi:unnamed protein product [Caretta caretta]
MRAAPPYGGSAARRIPSQSQRSGGGGQCSGNSHPEAGSSGPPAGSGARLGVGARRSLAAGCWESRGQPQQQQQQPAGARQGRCAAQTLPPGNRGRGGRGPGSAMAEATATAAAGGGAASTTVTETVTVEPENRSLTIKLRKRKPDKKVEWSSDTVDNEHLGRRSSKCCCIYEKPRAFGESSTESEDEEDEGCGNAHCIRGHRKGEHGGRGGGGSGGGKGSPRKAEAPGQDHAAAMQH